MSVIETYVRAARWAAGVVAVIVAALVFIPSPAVAQFICDSTTGGSTTSTAGGSFATACGILTTASGDQSIAFGTWFDKNGDGSFFSLPPLTFQMDEVTSATQTGASAFGPAAQATGQFSTAVGVLSTAAGDSSVAIGNGATVNAGGTNSVAVGSGNTVTGVGSGAFGTGQTVNGNGSFAIGDPNTVNGNNSFVFGDNNTINADNAVAIGNSNTVNGNSAMAIGNGSQANFANSAAFGSGATTTRANQQAFGTTSNTYTMSGIASAASKAAQSGPTQLVTSDSAGNLATTTLADLGIASTSALGTINRRLDDLAARSNRASNGIAMAFAMAGVPTLLPGETLAMTMNYGTFEGASGLALNAALRLNDTLQVTGGIGYGVDEQIAGGRVGLRMAW